MGRAGLPSEVLDDDVARGLFVDVDPQKADGRGRVFRMSFDARQYDPADVAVSCDAGCLVVEAKHVEHDAAGSKVVRQFQRRIQLPRAVDPGKLTSTLSTDGILTVEAPVPPCYQSVVGPAQNDPIPMTASVPPARASPVSIRLEPGAGRSSSPFLDTAGRRSPFTTTHRPLPGDAAFINTGLRSSPVQFGSLAPITALAPSTSQRPSTIDVPVVTTDPATGRRRLELLMELGQPYTADDVVVRVDGRRLTIDARHESRDQQGRVTTSTAQKQFDIGEQLDETSVEATMRDDGKMVITGHIIQ